MTLHRTEEAEEKIAPNGRRSRREKCTEWKKQKRKLHRMEEAEEKIAPNGRRDR